MKKSPLYMIVFLTVLGLICSGLLSGVNALTKEQIAKNESAKLAESLKALQISDPEQITDQELPEGVVAYQGKFAENSCYVFEIEKSNRYTTFSTLIAMSLEGKILAIAPKGTSGFTTHSMDSAFLNNGFGVVGSQENTYSANFQNVTSATFSANSVKEAIATAFTVFNILNAEE